MHLVPVLILSLFACSGDDPKDSGGADSDTDTDAETGEPAPDPVWGEHRIETASTLQGIYASGDGVYVAGTGALAWVGGADDAWVTMHPDIGENDLTDLWGAGAGETLSLYASGTSGYLAHYAAGAWTTEDLGTANHEGLGGSGPESLFAVSWGGVHRFDGTSWTFEPAPNDEKLNEVFAIGDEAFAVGQAGSIVHRTAAGEWVAMESGVTVDLHGVAGSTLTDVWAVGDDGVALHYTGGTWDVVDAGTTKPLWAVFAPGSSAVFAVGNNGTAVRWDGAAWSALPTGVDNNLYAIHGVSATNVWAVGNRGMTIQYKE